MLLLLFACAGGPDDTAASVPAIGDPDYERDPALDVDLTSTSGGTTSHNMGEPCMHCHQAHGPGRGQFTIAGTAYREDGTTATEGAIQAWLGGTDGGSLLVEMPIDANGNFYTTEDVGLPANAFIPVVLNGAGEAVSEMPWPTESGSCNQCHTPVKRVIQP